MAPSYIDLPFVIPDKGVAVFISELITELQADGFVCPKKLQVLLRHIDIELRNTVFMMRKYVYEQRHSIWLSKEQLSLLNCFR